MVIYKALYDDFGLWVRPLKMFIEDVNINGKVKKKICIFGRKNIKILK